LKGSYQLVSPVVLFADDDEEMRELIRILLGQKGIQLIGAANGREALDAWGQQTVHLIILDVMMPVMDGLETLGRIRQISNIPVILLTAKDQESDILEGFAQGANDYVIKPFRPAELVARVQSKLGDGAETHPLGTIEYGPLKVDLKRHQVTCQGQAIDLSQLELNLLIYLMKHPGEIVSKQELLKFVWGYQNTHFDLNLVEAVVVRLRKKIKTGRDCPELIQTVRGAGYRFGEKEQV
jgi:two-component system, OmpR family, response regulator MtrA